MSVQAMTWALAQRVVTEASARHVLLCLANYAGPKGEGAFPSVATLAEDTGLSTRTVQNKLRELETQKVIQRGNQDLVKAYIRRADQRPVCYDIDLSRGAPVSPRVEHSEAQSRGEPAAPRDERGESDDATGCSSRRHGVNLTTSRGERAAPDPSLNRQGTINEPKGVRKRSPGFDPMSVELPDWLDADLWARWVRHRVQIRKPLTEEAAKQQVTDLDEFRKRGHTPQAVITNAIGKSWQGLFAPNGAAAGGAQRPGKFNPTAHVNRNRTRTRAPGGNDYDDGRTMTPEQAVNAWLLPRTKLEGISAIDHLWNRLSGTYGGRWLKDFPDMDSIENWKTAWAEALHDDHVTPHEVADGLRACRRLFPDWPPAVGEFIQACRPALEPEVAFYTAVAGMAARHNGEQGTWPHPAIFWAAVEVGAHDLQHCPYTTMKARWERSLNEVLARGEWKPVPAMVKALPAPPVTAQTRAQAEEQMRKIGATGIMNQSGRDPMRGWKRVIAETENPKGKRYSPGVVAMARNALRLDAGQGAQA